MFISFLATLRQRRALQGSMGALLRRSDEHLLEDIGLTRHDIATMIASPVRAPLGHSAILSAAAAYA